MPNSPRRLAEIVEAVLAERGWHTTHSSPRLGAPAKDHSQLVFIGNWQDPCPRRLLFDANLEPIDIVTWQVIRVHADANKIVAFPSYTELMRAVRASRATIARALAVLRLTRWLPLCAALRDPNGRFAGHVYALNDEPLPVAEVLGIDDGYVQFIEHAKGHRSAHVRALAQDAFAEIEAAAMSSANSALDPVRLGDQVARRVEEMLHLVGDRALGSADRVQNLNSVRSSSSNSKKTTTTATQGASGSTGLGDRSDPLALIFPEVLSLTDSQRRVLALRLQPLPTSVRQAILDEAAGRVLAKRSTADPVRCEFDYVARLCAKARDDQFVLTDAGERVRRRREERAQGEERLRRAREYSEAQRLKELEKHRRE